MKTSESIKSIYLAVIKAQSEFVDLKKDTTNPYFKSHYVELAQVLSSIRPILKANDLAILQFPEQINEGKLTLTTRLIHSSGEYLESTCEVPLQKQDPQGFGSTLTYAKRYSIISILGLIADEDDDGNKAVQQPKQELKQETKTVASKPAYKPQTKTNITATLLSGEWNETKKRSEYIIKTEDNEGNEKEITVLIKKPLKKTLSKEIKLINYWTSEFQGKTYFMAEDIEDFIDIPFGA